MQPSSLPEYKIIEEKYQGCSQKNPVPETVFEYKAQLTVCAWYGIVFCSSYTAHHKLSGTWHKRSFHGTPRIQDSGTMKLDSTALISWRVNQEKCHAALSQELSHRQNGLYITRHRLCCGSGSRLDPNSMGSLDPDSQSRSGSRRAKMTHKNRKKVVISFF